MNWQLAVVMGMVALAGGYLSWRSWRAWKKAAKGCSGGCGCASAAAAGKGAETGTVLISRDSLKLRAKS